MIPGLTPEEAGEVFDPSPEEVKAEGQRARRSNRLGLVVLLIVLGILALIRFGEPTGGIR